MAVHNGDGVGWTKSFGRVKNDVAGAADAGGRGPEGAGSLGSGVD